MTLTPVTRLYMIRARDADLGLSWARIWITDDGCISILSDYGNYGYWFGAPGCEFRKFLCKTDPDSYLGNKFSDGEREYDREATLAKWTTRIEECAQENTLSEAELQHERSLLREFENLWSEADLARWYFHSGTKLPDDSGEGVAIYRQPIQLTMFLKVLWPKFVEQLKAELAAEAQQQVGALDQV